jgi:hypothetical protein
LDALELGLLCAPGRLASGQARAALAAPAQVRARDAEADLGSNGLGGLVSVRQRNVEAQGFPAELAGAADGVFLDLPSPWLVRSCPTLSWTCPSPALCAPARYALGRQAAQPSAAGRCRVVRCGLQAGPGARHVRGRTRRSLRHGCLRHDTVYWLLDDCTCVCRMQQHKLALLPFSPGAQGLGQPTQQV